MRGPSAPRPHDHRLPTHRGHGVQRLNRGLLFFVAVCKSTVEHSACYESGACICPRTWLPKPLAARRTRARDQDDRREARIV
jgi:hypothetical protein